MTTDEHQLLKRHLLQSESERWFQVVVRNFTYANLSSLVIWLGLVLIYSEINIFWWLKTSALTVVFFFSGWLADRLWFVLFSRRFDKSFGLIAYISRMPLWIIITGIFCAAVMLQLKPESSGVIYFIVAGLLQCLAQIPLQWSLVQRLRKLCLTNL